MSHPHGEEPSTTRQVRRPGCAIHNSQVIDRRAATCNQHAKGEELGIAVWGLKADRVGGPVRGFGPRLPVGGGVDNFWVPQKISRDISVGN